MKEIIKILNNYKIVKKEFLIWLSVWMIFIMISLSYPKITQYLIEIIEHKWSLNDFYYWIIFLFTYTLVFIWMNIIHDYFRIKVWMNLFKKKWIYYQKEVLNKNYKDIVDIWTWKLVTRLESGVEREVNIFSSIFNILVEAIFRWLVVIIILLFYIPKLIFIVLWWIIVLFIWNYYLRKYISKYTKLEQEFIEDFWVNKTRIVMENLTIKLFSKKEIELNKIEKCLEWSKICWIKVSIANEIYYKLLEWILKLIELWAYFVIWYIILKEWTYDIAYLIMIIWYIWFLWTPIDKAVSNLNRINRDLEKYKKLQEFIKKPNDIEDWKKDYIYKTWKIEFKNLDFWYSEKNNIFKNLNLNFLEWKKNALVWHSWGWKSTIIKILLRLYDYGNWEILLDWQELKKIKIESFYKEIWYLPQDPGIFDWTIRENMEYAFSEDGETRDKEKLIWEALEKSQVSDMVKKLEKGLDTEVWEKWVKLSWWEKQRLAIARIFLKNPKIIILDEPTSALDSISEARITKALDELMKNRTSIIIAHRLQTVMHSDKISVLENWKIESEGKHNELLQKSEVYKTLIDLQNGEIIE